jgi:hypothetical protein
MCLLLLAVFLRDIARWPHVTVLSALGLGAGVSAFGATLRNHRLLVAVSTVVCSALRAAMLAGGLLLR